VQGIGQALLEHAVYDEDSGQLLAGSFMDYAMPRAGDIPALAFSTHNVPSTSNPFGVKGAGEAGSVGAPPAVINAIVDALHHGSGVRHRYAGDAAPRVGDAQRQVLTGWQLLGRVAIRIVPPCVANARMVRVSPGDQRFEWGKKRVADLGQFVFDARRDLGDTRSPRSRAIRRRSPPCRRKG
jgi:hypothetical protein